MTNSLTVLNENFTVKESSNKYSINIGFLYQYSSTDLQFIPISYNMDWIILIKLFSYIT